MKIHRIIFCIVAFLALGTLIGHSADWPIWRGPDRNDTSPDTGLLKKWPASGPKKLWTYDQAGVGYAGFSIVDGVLFTMGTRDADWHVIAVEVETGKEKWAAKIAPDDQKGYNTGWGHGPRGTPTVNEGKVYALGPKGILACLDAVTGSAVWQTSLTADYQGKVPGWGYSESPLVEGKMVVVTPGGPEGGSVLALDKSTGAKLWHSKGLTGSAKDNAHYSSAQLIEWNGKRQILQLFQNTIVSLDAGSGALIWKTPWKNGATAVIPTPIFDKGYLYVTSGYNAGCELFQVGSDDKVTSIWDNKEMKNHHGGVVKLGDHVYGFSDGPGLSCQEFLTGKRVWNQKSPTLNKGAVHLADGMLFCLNEGDGVVTLVEADPTSFKKLGEFTLQPQSKNRNPQGRIWTHPVVLDGRLFLRDQEFIVCYQVK